MERDPGAKPYPSLEDRPSLLVREDKSGRSLPQQLTCSFLPDATVIDVNTAYCDYFGITREAIIGRSFLTLVPEEDHDAVQATLTKLRQTGLPHLATHQVTQMDGTRRIMQWTDLPVKDERGQVIRVESLGIDVTELVHLQDEMRHRDVLLEAVADMGSLLISATEPFAFMNEALGYIGRALDVDRVYLFENETVPPDLTLCMTQRYEWCREGISPQIDNPQFQQLPYPQFPALLDALSAGDTYGGLVANLSQKEQAMLSPQGILSFQILPIIVEQEWWGFIGFDDCHSSRSWSVSESEIIRTAAAMIGGVIGRATAIQTLAEREAKYRNLYQLVRLMTDNVPDMIWAKDIQGRYMFTNQAMSQTILELANTLDAIGKTDREIYREHPDGLQIPDQVLDQWMESDQAILRTRKSCAQREFGFIDGQRREFDVFKAPLNDERGMLIGTVGCARDVTERNQLEEQVRQAQKMEAVGLLAGGIAHDFNNLLMVVINGIELGKRLLEPDLPALPHLRDAQDAARRAAELTRRLLTFSRQQPPLLNVGDLRQTIHNVERLARRMMGDGIVLQVQTSPHPLYVSHDAGQIDQLILNLVSNSRDAMPEGGSLDLNLTSVDHLPEQATLFPSESHQNISAYARIRVCDSGTGIEPLVQEQMFQPFFTTKGVGKGTGLGLSVVYGIVKQHQGAILIESKPGKGTTIDIFLPLAGPPPKTDNTVAPSKGKRAKLTGHVLLVDDDPSVLSINARMLSEIGMTHDSVQSAGAAMEKLAQKNPSYQWVLSDMYMPGQGGEALLRYLNQHHPKIPVILMTGYTERMEDISRIQHPRMKLLAKPFSIDELEMTLLSLL